MSKDSSVSKTDVITELDLQLDSDVARQFENNSFSSTGSDVAPVVTAGLGSNDSESPLSFSKESIGETLEGGQPPMPKQVWERRKGLRLYEEDKGLKGRFRREINYLVGLVESSWRGWFALMFFLIMAVFLLLWSLTIRHGLIREHDFLEKEYLQKQLTVDGLMERWSQGELRTLKERVQSAESRVFPDYQKLASWLNEQSQLAEQLNLTMQYNSSKSLFTQIKNVGEVPITIKVSAKPEFTQHSYLRMLEFIHGLVDDQWHLEMTNTLVQSNGAGVTNMDVGIHVWVHDEKIEKVAP